MSKKKDSVGWTKPAVSVAIASAIISMVAAGSAWKSAKDARVSGAQASAVVTYLELQKNFDEVARRIPNIYRDGDPQPPAKDSNAWRGISRYWYLAFEGWLTTKRFGNETLAVLWDERYRDPIAAQLDKQAYRAVLCRLIREKFSQSSLQTEFGRMYADLYQERSGKELCR